MDNDIIDLSNDWAPSSNSNKINFGGGLELLMNDKAKDSSSKSRSDIDIEDLNNLEAELNDLADTSSSSGNYGAPLFSSFSSPSEK